jgi:NADH-quinone oxidoreductase subunit L
MALSVAAACAGGGLAWRSYGKAGKDYKEPIAAVAPPVYNTLLNKYYVDEAYDYAFTGRRKIGSVRLGAMGLGEASSWFDSHIVDGLVNGAGWLTRLSAKISAVLDWILDTFGVRGPAYAAYVLAFFVKFVQFGLVQWYALVMAVGLIGLLAFQLGIMFWFWMFIAAAFMISVAYLLLRHFVWGRA